MKTWIVKLRVPDKQHFWFGNFEAPGRNEAKREARLFVSKHFSDDVLILAIAEGYIKTVISGEEITVEDDV